METPPNENGLFVTVLVFGILLVAIGFSVRAYQTSLIVETQITTTASLSH